MNFFDFVWLAGGLAMFLYGMTIMGSGLEKLAGGKTESLLQRLTSSTTKGVLLGTLVTALIQSSSGTTVIVIGLVNSGIMQFTQAIGVVMGANIGTTVTGQLIRLTALSADNFLLRLLEPQTFAPVLAAAGCVMYVFMRSVKRRNIGQILLGFGILFFGMFTMSDAVYGLRDSELFRQLFGTLQNPLLGILVGTIVTAIIQSSSASVGILQALSTTGLISWGSAIPIILGQNIGTCATALLASIGASRAAKRVAFAHLYFNIIGTALFISALYAFKAIFGIPFWGEPIGMGGIANFHTLFNLVTTLLFIPFSWVLVRLAEWTVPDRKQDAHPELVAAVLDKRLYGTPSVAIAQARRAVEQMADLGGLILQGAVPLLFHYKEEEVALAQQREDIIDKLDVSISNYLVDMNELDLAEADSREVTVLLHFVIEFERIGDYAINIVERSGEVFDKEIAFTETARYELGVLSAATGEILDITRQAFIYGDTEPAARVEPLEEVIDKICEALRARHIARLKDGLCSIEAGIVFLEVLTDFERISDHCSNVAARMVSAEDDTFDMHELRRSLHDGNLPKYKTLEDHYMNKYYHQLDQPAPAADAPLPAPAAQV